MHHPSLCQQTRQRCTAVAPVARGVLWPAFDARSLGQTLMAGSLSEPRAAVAPIVAAIGGVLGPAAVYLLLNPGRTAPGWAIPADTGIAFRRLLSSR